MTVPDGAVTNSITVQTPGGTAVSQDVFYVTELRDGVLTVDGDLDPKDFIVGYDLHAANIDNDEGVFSLHIPEDQLTLIAASSSGEANNTYLVFLYPYYVSNSSQSTQVMDSPRVDGQAPFEINAFTTAKALLFMNPMLLTDDPDIIGIVENLLNTVPEVKELERVIAERYPQGADGLNDPDVLAAWTAATHALQNAIPDEYMISLDDEDLNGSQTIAYGKRASRISLPSTNFPIDKSPSPVNHKATQQRTSITGRTSKYGGLTQIISACGI